MDQLTLSCPACAQPVGEEDKYCEQCGTDLRAARGAGPGVPPPPPPAALAAAPAPPAPPAVPAAPPGQPAAAAVPDPAGSAGPALGPAPAPPGGSAARAVGVGGDAAPHAAPQEPGGGAGAARPGDPRTVALGAVPPPPAAEEAPATGDFLIAAPSQLLVDEQADEPQAPAADDDGGAAVCAGCGARRIDADGYCEMCGRPLPRPRDHQERALESIAGVSDRGHRHHRNEDAFAVAATRRPDGSPAVVAVVCDGVSSATRPDEASQTAADTASEQLLEALETGTGTESAMHAAIVRAAHAVVDLARQGPPEPGHNSPACTCVSAVAADGRCTIGWVGDSRAYWIPDDERATGAERLTVDDSWAARMVEAGLMSEAEAFADPRAHAITGWLGADAVELEPHTRTFVPPTAGVVLLCTDGLWNYAEAAAEMAAAVPKDARLRPLEAARSLVRFALENGGHDNVTVAVLPWLPPGRPPAAPEPPHPPTEVALRVPLPPQPGAHPQPEHQPAPPPYPRQP